VGGHGREPRLAGRGLEGGQDALDQRVPAPGGGRGLGALDQGGGETAECGAVDRGGHAVAAGLGAEAAGQFLGQPAARPPGGDADDVRGERISRRGGPKVGQDGGQRRGVRGDVMGQAGHGRHRRAYLRHGHPGAPGVTGQSARGCHGKSAGFSGEPRDEQAGSRAQEG